MKQHLDDLGVAYVENPRMVRGLDYYTKTTFEFVHDGLGAQSGIGGGGRYDGLMAVLGGQPLSGVGYGIGVDRTLLACRVEGLEGPLLPGRRPAATCSECRSATPHGGGSWCWRRRCAAPGCGWTSPTADAGSRGP